MRLGSRIFCGGFALLSFIAAHAADLGSVAVDARAASRGIMKARLRMPVSPGEITLLYPKWLPGRHSPAGPITSLGAPRFSANDAPLVWNRDPLDPYAFHVEIPAGTNTLDCDLEIDTLPAPDGVVQGLETPRAATESLLILEWNQLLLYPANARSDELTVTPSVLLPAGWEFASALDAAPPSENLATGSQAVRFSPVSLTTLVDSTLLAGRHFKHIALGGTPPVTLHIAADDPVALNISADTERHFRQLVRETAMLFGTTHYSHYEFLWALTDQIMPDGLEHHQSSDDRSPLRALIDDPVRRAEANLLPHEYVHSWNGKYRRPRGLATANYQEPMQDEMLWVYEGLTEYLGDVLATRSGLLTQAEFRDELARIAAAMDSHKSREWRSLADTLSAAPLLYYQSRGWAARLRRQDDFYQEPALLWLEADTLIRRETHGRKSLDDFCQLFFGVRSGVRSGARSGVRGTAAPIGSPTLVAYDFDDVVKALDAVYPFDWSRFWRERLERVRAGAPLEGVHAAGWQLALTAVPSSMLIAHEADDKDLDLRYSLGFYVDDEGATIGDIIPGSPADHAALAPGSRVIALNGYKWSKDLLHSTLSAPANSATVLNLLIEKDDMYTTIALPYSDGERYPNLVRDSKLVDLLEQIARPRAAERL